MTAEKVKGFRGFLLNISETIQLIFIKLMSFFRQLSTVSFEIKKFKTGSQFMRGSWAKNHDQREV